MKQNLIVQSTYTRGTGPLESKLFHLANGVDIPVIGFGPMIMGYGQKIRKPARWNVLLRGLNKYIIKKWAYRRFVTEIAQGILSGFRLIDYATAYGNLDAIGISIEKSGIPRSELFLTGRVMNSSQLAGKQAVWKEIQDILHAYRTDYLDLLMFHWPVPGHFQETWEVLCKAYESGLCRSIGVANCHKHHLECLKGTIPPMVNQVEVHPLLSQEDLVAYCQDCGILVESYTPLARMDDRLYRLPRLRRIAEAHNKTSAQVVLRWHHQRGLVPCVRSLNRQRQVENLNVFDFSLTEDEMKTISSFNINSRLRFDPDNCDYTVL